MKRILVIKMSALGDIVQALAAFRQIRSAHSKAHLTLLTTPAFENFAAQTRLFDRIETDGRPGTLTLTIAMLRRLRRNKYVRVYDLQASTRSRAMFYFLWPTVKEWSGTSMGCSHPHRNPQRMHMHTLEREAEQLRDAGIWPDAPVTPGSAPPPDVDFMAGDHPASRLQALGLSEPYVLLVPGSSATRLAKRWPASAYAELARRLLNSRLNVALVGGSAEVEIGQAIEAAVPGVANLINRTSLDDVVDLGRGAAVAIGNDTGPTHLLAAAGAPTLVLFSADSDPRLCAPRGVSVSVLREAQLADVSVDAVMSQIDALQPQLAVARPH